MVGRRHAALLASWGLAWSMGACSSNAPTTAITDDAGTDVDAATHDATTETIDAAADTSHDAGDSTLDVVEDTTKPPPDTSVPPDTGSCDPGCHIDCLSTTGGAICAGDHVWQEAHGYRLVKCCGDPWPGPGPACTDDTPAYSCTKGCNTAPVDPRYASCFPIGPPGAVSSELYALFCNEGAPKSVGAPCTGDADCRPSATSARLACDGTSHTCVASTRPAAPSGYGGSCGLDASSVSVGAEQLVTGATCALCVVDYPSGAPCVRQACTTSCVFDDDCPDGSVCVCANAGTTSADAGTLGYRYCAAISDRTTPAGRTAWLACP